MLQQTDQHTRAQLRERIYAKTTSAGGGPGACSLWTGAVSSDGVPVIRVKDQGPQDARRVLYLILNGRQLPPGIRLTARCGRPRCLNFAHITVSQPSGSLADTFPARG